jgi:hypothetical protein
MYDSDGESVNPYATNFGKAIGFLTLFIFNFLVALAISMSMYYAKDKTLMWKKLWQIFGLLFAAELIIALLVMFVFRADFFVVFFFGGQVIVWLVRILLAIISGITTV